MTDFGQDGWPFTPTRLRDIVDSDTLAVVESGCSERIGKPLTILDRNPSNDGFVRIESVKGEQRYADFCRLFRSAEVDGGDEACKKADLEQAHRSWQHFLKTGDPFRIFKCHMGLLDMTHVIRVQDQPVALLFSGQYQSPETLDTIQTNIGTIGFGSLAHIQPGEAVRDELFQQVETIKPLPADSRQRLEREIAHIERITEAEFGRRKREAESNFLDELRRAARPRSVDRTHLTKNLEGVLELARAFCQCSYLVLFGGTRASQTVLTPLAQAGVPAELASNLPHFNRRKANLPAPEEQQDGLGRPCFGGSEISGGVRGRNAGFFGEAACAVPIGLGGGYQGVLVFGPLASKVEWQREQRFLVDLAHAASTFALAELGVIKLEAERRRWLDMPDLLAHQIGTALTPITTKIGRAKALSKKTGTRAGSTRLGGLLAEAEDLALLLADSAKKTVRGRVLLVERGDLLFERYPLSVLVENVASGFVQRAAERDVELIVEDSVEALPHAVVDVARLTIALANLIENAVKYSHPGRAIYVRAHLGSIDDLKNIKAVIEVDDLGFGIPKSEQEHIFEHGERGLVAAKLGHIPGSGLGLWEARAVVAAHGGEITVRCRPTRVMTSAGKGHHVVFAIKIPLEQKGGR